MRGVRFVRNWQLVPLFQVVGLSHFSVAHYDQLPFLEGMKPGNEDIGSHSACEQQQTDGHLGNVLVKAIPTLAGPPNDTIAARYYSQQLCGVSPATLSGNRSIVC